jgi:hypothetical protein
MTNRRRVAARLVAVWILATLAVLAVARTVVALPERCGQPTPDRVDQAIVDSVGWLQRNQQPDGRWLYRYDGPADRDLGDYNWVRHAGVLLSLEQAARLMTGDTAAAAAATADRGWDAVEREAITVDTPTGPGRVLATTGGSALAGVAWAERRERTGDPALDDDLAAWLRVVAHQVQADGSVWNQFDMATGQSIPGSTGPFSTGQALFLLYRTARLVADHGVMIDHDLISPARRIGHYIARERANAEGFVPDTSDHWAAYGFADLVSTTNADNAMTADEAAFVRKQIGIGGVQVRYESQRTNTGVDRWLRGRQTLPAGLGTVGEALWGWWVVAQQHPALQRYDAELATRLACTAGMLVDRQADADAAALSADPARVQGAWFQFGITQMDDQQHALSALLLARDSGTLPESGRLDLIPRRSQVPESVWLVILAAVVLANPIRMGRRGRGCTVTTPAMGAVAAVAGLTAAGGPVLRALNISAATAVVAAGLVAVMAGLIGAASAGRDAQHRDAGSLEVALQTLMRPELIVASLAIGAGGKGWTWVLAVAVSITVGAALASRPTSVDSSVPAVVWVWALRLFAAAAVVAGVAVVVEGIYAA